MLLQESWLLCLYLLLCSPLAQPHLSARHSQARTKEKQFEVGLRVQLLGSASCSSEFSRLVTRLVSFVMFWHTISNENTINCCGGTGELSETLRADAAQLVQLVAAALLHTIRLGGTVPAYGGGVGMGSVQDGITGVLSNILRPDKDLASARRSSPTDANSTLLLPDNDTFDPPNQDLEVLAPHRRQRVQQGQALFLQKYGIAELSKLQVLTLTVDLTPASCNTNNRFCLLCLLVNTLSIPTLHVPHPYIFTNPLSACSSGLLISVMP